MSDIERIRQAVLRGETPHVCFFGEYLGRVVGMDESKGKDWTEFLIVDRFGTTCRLGPIGLSYPTQNIGEALEV